MVVGIKGAGEMASAAAWRLHRAHIRTIFMMETAVPLAVRRGVCFCEAVHDGFKTVEGVTAVLATSAEDIPRAWDRGAVAVRVDPGWQSLQEIRPDVVVDGILAKKNLGTQKEDARLVVGLGPGFTAGADVHAVVETNRGHNLGRIITSGPAEPDTGIPGPIDGIAEPRVLRAPSAGVFLSERNIGDLLRRGDCAGRVGDVDLLARISGVLRGLLRPGTRVTHGQKVGDIDPRGNVSYCFTISDKARAIAGSVLEVILRVFNQ